MNVVYISEVYLNFTPGSQAHQVFVSGKTRDQSKKHWTNKKLGLRIEAKQKYNWFIDCSIPEVNLRVTVHA